MPHGIPGTYGGGGNRESATCRFQERIEIPNPSLSATDSTFPRFRWATLPANLLQSFLLVSAESGRHPDPTGWFGLRNSHCSAWAGKAGQEIPELHRHPAEDKQVMAWIPVASGVSQCKIGAVTKNVIATARLTMFKSKPRWNRIGSDTTRTA